MRRLLLTALLISLVTTAIHAEQVTTVNVQGKDYQMVKLQERPIGPGAVYHRYRLPDFPLNINMVTVDMNDPNIKIETTISNESSSGTELLVDAAARHDATNHHAIAAQNGNFWIVSTQPQWAAYNASPHGIALRNGMLSADSKTNPHWWWWDTTRSGIVSVSTDNRLFIDLCRSEMTATGDKIGTIELNTCNKGFKPGKIAFYTPYFGSSRSFIPLLADTQEQLNSNDIHYDVDNNAECTEVLLSLNSGQSWCGGTDMTFTVISVAQNNGLGTLGTADLAIVGRTADFPKLATLTAGDQLTLNYSWTFDPDGNAVTPKIDQALGGNMMIMRHGVITEQNAWDSYDTMIYSRSAYGSSQDGKTLYMITIDKSIDPVYGTSNGCTTAEMCDIVRTFGVYNLINVDAGGSAQLMVDNQIINKTTEGKPRAVNNGWMVFNTAPDDETAIASLVFYDIELSAPVNSLYSPRVIALNKYGTVLNDDYRDFIVTNNDATGIGKDNALQVGTESGEGTITISTPDGIVTASKAITLVQSAPTLKRSEILIDKWHTYPIEVQTVYNGKTYDFDPAIVTWTSEDPQIAFVDDSGTLHATGRNGTVKITGVYGDMNETLTVSSETTWFWYDDPIHPTDWAEWTVKGVSGLKDVTINDKGELSFTYNSVRGASWVALSKDFTFYGLPIDFYLDFTPDMPVTKVELDIHTPDDPRGSITITPETPYATGETHCIEFKFEDYFDIHDVRNYPLKMSTIRFTSPASSTYKGDHKFALGTVSVNYISGLGVEDVSISEPTLTIYPNPVERGCDITINATSEVSRADVYDLTGRLIDSKTFADATTHIIPAPQTPGMYIVRVTTAVGISSQRVIVR